MREWEAKFGEYVAARSGSLVRFAYLLCGDWHRAEDTVQRALTKLYLAWNRLDHTEVIDAYVPAIVVRMLVVPRTTPRSPSWRMSRSTVQRATGIPSRLSCAQILSAP